MGPDSPEGLYRQELAQWRGGIEARVEALQKAYDQMVRTMSRLGNGVTQINGRLDNLAREVAECREDVAAAAGKIDKSKDDAVDELKRTLERRDEQGHLWKLTKTQVIATGVIVVLLAPLVAALINLALSGVLK